MRSTMLALLGLTVFFQVLPIRAQSSSPLREDSGGQAAKTSPDADGVVVNKRGERRSPQPPYVYAATFWIAVDDWADIWLNGVHLIERCPYTRRGEGSHQFEATYSSLCYLQRENILAIKNTDTLKQPQGQDEVGIAYILKLVFSDGSVKGITSEETKEHRCFYIPNSDLPEPSGWKEMNFNDSKWDTAQNSGTLIPGCAVLYNEKLDEDVSFLTASTEGYFAQHLGEKHLYRRKFSLDISRAPQCSPDTPTPVPVKRSSPVRVVRPTYTSTRGPVRSITPFLLWAQNRPIAAPPTLIRPTPVPTATKRVATPVIRPLATPTPRPVIYRPPVVLPTATPTRTMVPRPTPTRVILKRPTATATPTVVVPTPTLSPTEITEASAMAVTFSAPPANVLVTFADGPGVYQVEAVDSQGNHLKTLMNQRILKATDTWISWDGKDDQGTDVPPGQYFVLCSKEGRMLHKILLVRISQ